MPSNKLRLYVTLYARGGAPVMPGFEDTYHWALLVGPKIETQDLLGTRYHAKEVVNGREQIDWVFEERGTSLLATQMLLGRILIGKVKNPDQLASILRNVPLRQGEPGWNCVGWVKEGLQALEADKKTMGTCILEWSTVRDTAMRYMQEKKDQHRFDGQRVFDMTKAATYDLLAGKETIP